MIEYYVKSYNNKSIQLTSPDTRRTTDKYTKKDRQFILFILFTYLYVVATISKNRFKKKKFCLSCTLDDDKNVECFGYNIPWMPKCFGA